MTPAKLESVGWWGLNALTGLAAIGLMEAAIGLMEVAQGGISGSEQIEARGSGPAVVTLAPGNRDKGAPFCKDL